MRLPALNRFYNSEELPPFSAPHSPGSWALRARMRRFFSPPGKRRRVQNLMALRYLDPVQVNFWLRELT
jgi:hypothetical protein